MMPHRIVITGAPASGKTVFIDKLKKHPTFTDFVFFDELARQLLSENPNYRYNHLEFHRQIYKRQTGREEAIGNKPFITDRGTVDAFAFHPETLQDVGTTIEKEYNRYDAVILLESSASLGEAYYTYDRIRKESLTDALAIEQALINAWEKHHNYHLINAETDIEKKYETFLNTLLNIVKVK